jgi:hypothetical protein
MVPNVELNTCRDLSHDPLFKIELLENDSVVIIIAKIITIDPCLHFFSILNYFRPKHGSIFPSK